jgi:hypothetical protein
MRLPCIFSKNVQTIRIKTAKGVVGQIIFLDLIDYAFRRFNPAVPPTPEGSYAFSPLGLGAQSSRSRRRVYTALFTLTYTKIMSYDDK